MFDIKKNFHKLDLKFFKRADVVVNLASLNSSDASKEPELAKKIKVEGTKYLLNELSRFSIKKYINISTSHVYGKNLTGTITEESKINPSDIYSEVHSKADEIISLYDGVIPEVYSLRLTNGVGSPLNKYSNCWSLLVNDLCKQAVISRKIVLKAPRYTKRDFIPIDFIVNSISCFLDKDTSRLDSKFCNISSGKLTTISSIANLIRDRFKILFNDYLEVIYLNKSLRKESERYNFSNKIIFNLGLKQNLSLSDEIDALLLNCSNWFKNGQ